MIIEQSTVNALKRVLQTTGSIDTITRVFHESSQTRIALLLLATESGNIDEVKTITHSLKGSCAMLGASSCVEICERIEQMAHESNLASLLSQVRVLKNEIELFEINLKQELLC